MVKYKSVKEIGKYSDYDMKKYYEIRQTANKRSLTLLLHGFADMPIFLFVMISSIVLSSIFSWWIITESLIKTGLIIVNTFDFTLLFICLTCISGIAILVFYLGVFSIAVLEHKCNKKKDIDEVVIDEQ